MKSQLRSILSTIPNRFFPILGAAFLLCFGLILYTLFILPAQLTYKQSSQQRDRLQATLKTYSVLKSKQGASGFGTDSKSEKILQTIQPDLASYLKLVNELLIVKPKVEGLTFQSINFDQNVQLSGKENDIQGQFQKILLDITMTGSYQSLGEYVQMLSDIPLLFNIFDVTLTPTGEQNVRMNLRLYFYFVY